MEHEFEWAEAQRIEISVDLVAAAKRHLGFLATVDRNRFLYDGPVLDRAIYRYNALWLPLLAKHSESPLVEGPLVVPLDCEWVWHCHRLNPVQYKSDCEKLYGRTLDNSNVVSSIQGACSKQTEELWNRFYPTECYEVDLGAATKEDFIEKNLKLEKRTTYDLVSAVKRQSPFFYQVARPHMSHDLFLQEAVARYKGFLHLIRRNRENSIKRFCVPTYDIDLIWHTHQLHPASYCKDLMTLLSKVLEHDDMDSDRSKGQKLDVGFTGTMRQWEETFGTRYWRAGAMYRGVAPSPVTTTSCVSNTKSSKVTSPFKYQDLVQNPEVQVVEVLLEIVGVKDLPENLKGSFYVSFTKSQPDTFFSVKRRLNILSQSKEKMVASFICEPKGELLFELVSYSSSGLLIKKTSKVVGSTSLPLEDYLVPVSKLSDQKWFELKPCLGCETSKPIRLHIAVSFSVPTTAPYMLHMVPSRPFGKSSCLFPLPSRVQHAKTWTRVINDDGSEIISFQMRSFKKDEGNDNCKKQITASTKSGETCTLAKCLNSGMWSMLDCHWSLQFQKKSSENSAFCELIGGKTVKFFLGRKLEYEPRNSNRRSNERYFITAVEFSSEDPYGKAVALIDFKSGLVKVKDEALLLPMVISAFILLDVLKTDGYNGFSASDKNLNTEKKDIKVSENHADINEDDKTATVESGEGSKIDAAKGGTGVPTAVLSSSAGCGGGCGSGCGSGCGNMAISSGCGGCGGGGCGSGCGGCGGGGCGSGSGCGGCGGGCGSHVSNEPKETHTLMNSGGCGGCGSGCGSGCGGTLNAKSS